MTNTQLQTTAEAREAAAFYAKHALASKAFAGIANESAAIIKIELGRELGMSAIASLQGIMFNERGGFTLSAALQGACLQRHGYSWKVVKLDDTECHLDIYRSGEKIGESTLTMKQAVAAKMNQQWSSKDNGWTEKHTWKSFPRNMLFARCLTNAVKWFAPEVLAGVPLYDPDEVDGLPPREGEVIDHDEAKRRSANANSNVIHPLGATDSGVPTGASPGDTSDRKPVSQRNRSLVSGLLDFYVSINDEAKGAAKMNDQQKAALFERIRKLERDVSVQLVLRDLKPLIPGETAKGALTQSREAINALIEHDRHAPVEPDADADEFDARTTTELLAA